MHDDRHPTRVAPRLNGRQSVRVAYSHTCQIIADHTTGMVPTTSDTGVGEDFLDHAIAAQMMITELLHRAITAARMSDTPWETIANRLGLTVPQTHHQYEHCDLNHLADADGATSTWPALAETCPSLIPDSCATTSPGDVALEIEDWHHGRSRHPGDPCAVPNPHPVTAGL